MKRTFFFAALLAFVGMADAQTLRVWDDTQYVAWLYDANTLQTPMPFSADGTLTIGGYSHKGHGIWMTVDNNLDELLKQPDVVYVYFTEEYTPVVYAPGNLAPYLTVKINSLTTSDIDITVADNLERELTFVLSGTGNTFALHGNYKTTVVLDGVDLRSTGDQPALWIDNGKRIDIMVNDGKMNIFSDAAMNQKKSAFFVKGHAEWKGGGDVTISGASRHAYSSNEYTIFKPTFTGTFTVPAAGSDGMHIEQYLEINNGTFNISGTKGDGIDVSYALEEDGKTPTKDENNGQFIMRGGDLTVTADVADTKGVKCEDKMTISAGRINATANGDGSRGIQTSSHLYLGTEGSADAKIAYLYLTGNGGEYTDPETDDVNKCRGLKVKGNFYHYPSTVERNAASVLTKKKIVDVDGTYFKLGGTLTGITIE